MAEVIERLFGKAKVLVKEGDFTDVQGEYHHYDYSQRITNDGSHNIIGNALHNVSNICPKVIYHDESGRPMHYGHSQVAGSVIINNHGASSSSYHPQSHPQSQGQFRNNPSPLSYSSFPPGQYLFTQSLAGDIREMSAGQFAYMNNQMAQMAQEMEFDEDDEEQNATVGYIESIFDDESATTRSQALLLSTQFNRLTIGERSSSPRSALIQGLSSTVGKTKETPRHIIISGDHVEVDNGVYQFDIDSHNVANNTIENSFGEVQTARR